MSISAGTRLWQLGDVLYARTSSSGHLGRRVKNTGTPFLALRKHFKGNGHSWWEDGYFPTQPCDSLMTLNTADGVHSCIDLDTNNIALPVDLLDVDVSKLPKTYILTAASLGNRLLSVGMDAWTNALERLPAQNAPKLAAQVVSLINHVLGAALQTDDIEETAAR